ncbi:hypothetical protein [Actinomadura sp. K4S16]|uniref:hypothetical protein n=1 Tax=Actinomadura sp. K4S16 TaxID=1316147 RepID=UPI0011EBE363|nr:hypothetical protein [Actinomadura sp. K4S16]
MIEIPREQWAVSTDGLYSLSRPYHIPIARISGAEDWRSHMRGLGWVDEGDFDEAYALARKLLTAPR